MDFTIETLIERNPHRTAQNIRSLVELDQPMRDRIWALRDEDIFGQWTNDSDETCAIYLVASDLAREQEIIARTTYRCTEVGTDDGYIIDYAASTPFGRAVTPNTSWLIVPNTGFDDK